MTCRLTNRVCGGKKTTRLTGTWYQSDKTGFSVCSALLFHIRKRSTYLSTPSLFCTFRTAAVTGCTSATYRLKGNSQETVFSIRNNQVCICTTFKTKPQETDRRRRIPFQVFPWAKTNRELSHLSQRKWAQAIWNFILDNLKGDTEICGFIFLL